MLCFIIPSLALALGRGTKILFSSLLNKAISSSQGRLLAASKNTLSLDDLISPSSYISNSVFILLLASCSPEEVLELKIESISSIKIVEG